MDRVFETRRTDVTSRDQLLSAASDGREFNHRDGQDNWGTPTALGILAGAGDSRGNMT